MKSATTSDSSGFTLIELLVVIAIISLLVSILLPSLNRARDIAKRVVCASNLRQQGTSLQMYAHDYDGWFTGAVFRIAPSTFRVWFYFIHQAGYLPAYGDATGGLKYECPVGREDTIYYTYGLNKESFFLGAPYPDDPAGYRDLNTIPRPSERFWVSEGAPTGMGYVISPDEDYGFAPERHDGVNVLYAGGHVAFLSYDSVPEPYPNPLYWAPPYPDPDFWGTRTE